MKKLIYLFLFLPNLLLSQSILNGNFENWNSIPYDEPDGWIISNPESLSRTGLPSVFKTTDSQSGFAIRLETVASTTDTSAGYFVNTQGDPLEGEGGVPYNQQPTHVSGYYKFNITGSDTALLLIVFKSGGTIVSSDLFKITGQQNTYVMFSFPLSLSVLPDTVIIAAASSNLVGNVGITAGSMIQFDQVAFTGTVPMPAVYNADFEIWNTVVLDQLTGWQYGGNTIGKTTDSYAGVYAVKMESIISQGNPVPSAISTGVPDTNGFSGGLPFSNTADTISGYYKYFNNSGDSGMVMATFYLNGSPVGYYGLMLPPVPVYTYFSIPVFLPVAPDTMRIDILSSKFPFLNIGNGSELYMDEIQLSSAPLSTGISISGSDNITEVFPNPVRENLYIRMNGIQDGTCLFHLYDAAGREIYMPVSRMSSFPELISIPVTELIPGIYAYTLTNGRQYYKGWFIKE